MWGSQGSSRTVELWRKGRTEEIYQVSKQFILFIAIFFRTISMFLPFSSHFTYVTFASEERYRVKITNFSKK